MKPFWILVRGAAFGFSIETFRRKQVFALAVCFWLVFCAIPLTLSVRAEAQQAQIPRIGYLSFYSDERDKLMAAFQHGLRELGYVEGKNILIEKRDAKDKRQQVPALIAELINLKVELIVTGAQGARAAKRVGSRIPIVLAYSANPVTEGLVASLARPGGNITGLSDYHGDLVTKRLELIKEIAPLASRVAILFHENNPANGPMVKDAESAAPGLGMRVLPLAVKNSNDIRQAFTTMEKELAAGFLQFVGLGGHRKQIVTLAVANRLPAIYTRGQWVASGGLMSYGAHWPDLYRRTATYVDKILKGAKPADLPVEQPKKFEFIVNLTTAQQMGLTFPPNVLVRADRVIR